LFSRYAKKDEISYDRRRIFFSIFLLFPCDSNAVIFNECICYLITILLNRDNHVGQGTVGKSLEAEGKDGGGSG
jgi:hypothetical protein